MLPNIPDEAIREGTLEILAACVGGALIFGAAGWLTIGLVWLILRYRYYLGRALFASIVPLLFLVGWVFMLKTGQFREW